MTTRTPKRQVVTEFECKQALEEIYKTDYLRRLEGHSNAQLDITHEYCADPICKAFDELFYQLRKRAGKPL